MTVYELVAKLVLDTSQYEGTLANVKNKTSGFGTGLKTLGKVAGVAFGMAETAVVAFGKSALGAGMSFDSAMGEVAATAGKTAEELEASTGEVDTAFGHFSGTLRDFAKFMGKNTAFSATQAAQALNYMALAGYNTQQSMEMLPNVLNMAAAGNMDLARASDMVTDTQSAFGISFKRTSLLVDEMAKAASTGNTSVEQLGDAFLTIGGLAKELNGGMITLADGTTTEVDGIQELEIALTSMANAGIKGSEAGTHMRNMLMKLSSPTKEGQKTFEALGVSIFDANGNMKSMRDIFGELNVALGGLTQGEKLEAISNIFNARDTASAEALLAAVGQDWDRIGESILQAKGSADQMAETKLDNLTGDMTKWRSALEGAQITLSDQLVPTYRAFVQFGTSSISKLTQAFESNGVEGFFDSLSEVAGEATVKLTEKLPEFIGIGFKVLESIGEGIVNNSDTLFMSLFTVMHNLATTVSQRLPSIIEGAADGLSGAISGFATIGTNIIVSLMNGLPRAFPTLLTGIGQVFTALYDAFMTHVPVLLQQLQTTLPILVEGGIEMLRQFGEGLVEGIPAFLESVLPMVLSFVEMLRENFGLIVDAGIELLMNFGTGIINALPTLIEYVPQIITEFCRIINDNVPKVIGAALTLLVQFGVGLVQNIPVIIANIGNIISAIVSVISAFNWISVGSQVLTMIANGFKALIMLPVSIFRNLGHSIITTFQNGFSWASLGSNIINGIVGGIRGAGGAIKDTLMGFAKSAFNAVKNFFGIASPSKLMRDAIGKFIPEGMAVGITANADSVYKAIDDLSEGTMDAFGTIDANASYGSNQYASLAGEISSLKGAILGMNVVLDTGAMVGGLSDGIDKQLGLNATRRARGI